MSALAESGARTPALPPAPHHSEGAPEQPPRKPSLLRIGVIAILVVVTLGALGASGMRSRSKVQTDRETVVAARADKPRVLTTKAERAPAKVEQVLPGTAAPLLETGLYARTSGYLKRWLVDIGDRVEEGQLLAEIETPEVDAQLLQARATLNEAQANLVRNKASAALAKLNLDRTRQGTERAVGSQQDLDAADAALKVAQATIQVTDATIKAGEANVKRLEDLQRFQKVTAPFPGVVTARNFDPGALIVADNASARELFHIARLDTIRVFADVPQTFATAVRAGQPAPVFRREAPGREFPGTVTRTTSAVDPRTRTLRVQVDVPNPDRALLPGMFLQVRFQLEGAPKVVRIPGAAVITRAEGTKVALLDSGNTVRYRAVKVGRDFGAVVEIVDGLSGGETIVLRPGDDMPEGTAVDPVSSSDR